MRFIRFYSLLAIIYGQVLQAGIVESEHHTFAVETLVRGLSHPWSMAFLPNGDVLVTERVGRLRLISEGKLLQDPIAGLPNIRQHGQGGLLDVVLHPDFQTNNFIYLAYAGKTLRGYGTEVLRAKYINNKLEDIKVIFKALPKSRGGRHFGGRLQFSHDKKLFITLGDRGDRPRAQDLHDHAGSLIRINADGSVPEDNPYLDKKAAQPEIFSYGHRNIQGITKHPLSNIIWTHEHGPQGGDEINIIRKGANYGWPVITYGVNYGTGTKIGEGTHKVGMEQPLYYWVPSIAPSGMTFYSGDEFVHWKNNLLVGSLKFGLLVRLEIDNNKVVHEERLLDGQYGRIRDIRQGPEGTLFLLTDQEQGAVLKLRNLTN